MAATAAGRPSSGGPLGLILRLLVIVVALVALVAVAVLALDGPARAAVENATADSLAKRGPFTARPTVSIDGWPVLVDAVAGFPQVRLAASGMPVAAGADQVTLADPRLTLSQVVVRPGSLTAADLAGTGVLSYAELSRLAGGTVAYADGDRVAYTARVSLLGQDVEAVVAGVPSLDVSAQTLSVKDATVSVVGLPLPAVPVDAVVALVAKPIALTLPSGLAMRSVTATAAGVGVEVGGTDITLPLGG